MRVRLSLRFLAIAALAATPAGAQTSPDCPLPYKVFEFAIPHVDLSRCPPSLESAGTFCRATASGDSVHVFVFAENGDQCLRSVKRYEPGAFSIELK